MLESALQLDVGDPPFHMNQSHLYVFKFGLGSTPFKLRRYLA